MKKITLAVAAVLMFGYTALAAANENRVGIGYTPETAPPITFMERGIEFFIFMDGQFDFNTAPTTGGAIYYKNGRRGVNSTYGAPGVPAGVIIEHDYLGRVRRVGNVFINYDAQDRIKRVGSVYMTYNRQYLTQVGGLKISYDRRGMIADIRGNVNSTNHYNTGTAYNNSSYYGPAAGHNANIYYKPGKTARK